MLEHRLHCQQIKKVVLLVLLWFLGIVLFPFTCLLCVWCDFHHLVLPGRAGCVLALLSRYSSFRRHLLSFSLGILEQYCVCCLMFALGLCVVCVILPTQQVIELFLYWLLTDELHILPPSDNYIYADRVMLIFLPAYPNDCRQVPGSIILVDVVVYLDLDVIKFLHRFQYGFYKILFTY